MFSEDLPPPSYSEVISGDCHNIPKDAIITTSQTLKNTSIVFSEDRKYRQLFSNVIKTRERYIKSRQFYQEIIEINNLTLEVNKNWKGRIVPDREFRENTPSNISFIGIFLMDIEGGNSNSWGKNKYLVQCPVV